ncbi:hypothetical protein BGZ92_011536 [Podila epicladia]|nr:hypothetical protein BGZ92_011536 [Podila epicladia]
MATWINLFLSEPVEEESPWGPQEQEEKPESFLDALSDSAEAPIEARISNAFKTIYQHLNEEHYIDRLVNALYTKSHKRAADAPSDHIIFGSERCDPCELETEESDYVFKKIQDLFLDLFRVPHFQTDLRQFLSMIYEVDKCDEVDDYGAEMLAHLLEHAPHIIKNLFPRLEGLTQESVNLCAVGRYDSAFKFEVRMLFRFIMLSLMDHEFAKAKDYTSECRKVVENLQMSFEKTEFKGPTERLMKIVVGLAEQFWDGGMIAKINHAIEQVMAALIKDAIQRDGQSQQAASAGWDVMKDFSRLLALMKVNVPPVPLPSVIVNRKNWILSLDSNTLSFPNMLPNNIQLNSTVKYDRAAKSAQREWHLKIRDMEVKAEKIAYCLQRRDRSAAHMTDIGVANVTIPANSLDMDFKFTVTTPDARKPTAPVSTSRRPCATSAPPSTSIAAQIPGEDQSRSRNRRSGTNTSSTTEDGRGGRQTESMVLTMTANVA